MKKVLLSLCVMTMVLSIQASGQIVNTIAGGGASIGDGGPATTAALIKPYFIAKDGADNIYITDFGNNRIRKVDASGIITTIAGTGTAGFSGDGGAATAAEIYNPVGIAVDNAGNVYFTDFGNHCLRKINTAGIISTIAGVGTSPGYSGDGGAATAARFWYPAGISLDTTGNIYIADKWNNRIRKISVSGIITTVAGSGPTGYLTGSHTGDGGAATAAQMNFLEDVAADNRGNIYVADAGNNCIRKINAAGIITNFAGTGIPAYSGDAGPATAAELSSPSGVAVDLAGNVYIGDAGNDRVRRVDHSGTILTICGWGVPGFYGDGGPATDAEVYGPAGVLIDCPGNVYFADNLNNRVRKIDNVNSIPVFVGGHSQSADLCADRSNDIDSILRISDFDPGQTESWMSITIPMHGSAATAYTGISTGSVLVPAGLSYTPTAGFTGADSFQVQVTDCANASEVTTIHVNVISCPLQITGLLTGNALSIYPVPTTGACTVVVAESFDEDVHIVVTDITGRKIVEQTSRTNKPTTLELTAGSGIYFISAATSHGLWNNEIVVE